jgi:hypothetical protein
MKKLNKNVKYEVVIHSEVYPKDIENLKLAIEPMVVEFHIYSSGSCKFRVSKNKIPCLWKDFITPSFQSTLFHIGTILNLLYYDISNNHACSKSKH